MIMYSGVVGSVGCAVTGARQPAGFSAVVASAAVVVGGSGAVRVCHRWIVTAGCDNGSAPTAGVVRTVPRGPTRFVALEISRPDV